MFNKLNEAIDYAKSVRSDVTVMYSPNDYKYHVIYNDAVDGFKLRGNYIPLVIIKMKQDITYPHLNILHHHY